MSKDLPPPQQSEEVDLGQLFKLIGKAFDRLFKFIGSIFNKIFLAFVWFIFFIRKHVLKFIIAGVLGFLIGFLIEKNSEPIYKSYVTVKQNYQTGENLYTSISYYRDLVEQNDTTTLKNALGIDVKEAASILDFDIQSVVSENEKLQNYNNYIKTLDSALAATVDYEKFIENSEEYLTRYQQISIKANARNNFKKVFEKIVENVNTNEYFKREQNKDLEQLKNEEEALNEALQQSDSLQKTYKRVLEKTIEKGVASQTNITIENAEEKSKTKEFELYRNDLELRQKLVKNKREQTNKKYIVEIISSKQDSGTIDDQVDFLGVKLSMKKYYFILLVGLTFIVLLGIHFLKFLEKYKDKI